MDGYEHEYGLGTTMNDYALYMLIYIYMYMYIYMKINVNLNMYKVHDIFM
jgi:hypothetical protein